MWRGKKGTKSYLNSIKHSTKSTELEAEQALSYLWACSQHYGPTNTSNSGPGINYECLPLLQKTLAKQTCYNTTDSFNAHTCRSIRCSFHSWFNCNHESLERLKEHAWEHPPFSHIKASHTAFVNRGTKRALTSLEEKTKVCERPDRLGSATNPEMSELGLPGLESSMTDKFWR